MNYPLWGLVIALGIYVGGAIIAYIFLIIEEKHSFTKHADRLRLSLPSKV